MQKLLDRPFRLGLFAALAVALVVAEIASARPFVFVPIALATFLAAGLLLRDIDHQPGQGSSRAARRRRRRQAAWDSQAGTSYATSTDWSSGSSNDAGGSNDGAGGPGCGGGGGGCGGGGS